MISRAYAWIVHQYQHVLHRMRVHDYMVEHPVVAMAAARGARRGRRGEKRPSMALETFEDRLLLSLTPITVIDPDSADTITIDGTAAAITITGAGATPLNQTVTDQTPLLVIQAAAGATNDIFKFNLASVNTSVLIDGGAGIDTLDLTGHATPMTVIKASDGSAIITDGTETIRAVNIENFTGANAIITEAGMPSWLAEGPNSITAGQDQLGPTPNNPVNNVVIGAINQAAVDPFDPNVMFVATVGGGVWRNNDRSVFFNTNGATLDADSTAAVDLYATFLKQNPSLVVTVTGFTDNTTNNAPGGNQTLSENRAHAVQTELLAQGVQAAQIVLGGTNGGAGETNPMASNATAGGQTLNRRVELVVNHWTPLTDSLSTLAIGSIAISKFDASGAAVTAATPLNQLVLYAGTGQLSSQGSGGAAIGLLISKDGGSTWLLNASSQLGGLNINSVIATGVKSGADEIVLVSALSANGKQGGLFQSTDGGKTFTQKVNSDGFSLVADPGNIDRYFAGVMGQGVMFSIDDGATWNVTATQPTDATGSAAGADRVVVAVQPGANASNVVFASIIRQVPAASNNFVPTAVFRSTDQGGTWNTYGDAATPVPMSNPGGQANSNFTMQVTADGANVFIAGDFDNVAGAVDGIFSAALFLGNGHTWTQQTKAATVNNSAPHADTRSMTFDSAGRLVETDDGGIARLRFTDQNDPTKFDWVSLDADLANTEVLSLAYDPLNNVFFAGDQDTGSPTQAGSGNATPLADPVDLNGDGIPDDIATRGVWSDVNVGDGQEQLAFATDLTHTLRFDLANNFTAFTVSTADSATGMFTVPVQVALGGVGLEPADIASAGPTGSSFITIPYAVNAKFPNRMLIAHFSLYESIDDLNTITPIVHQGGLAFTALAYGSANNADAIYAAKGNVVLLRTAAGAALAPVTKPVQGTGAIDAIAMDPDDFKIAYVARGSQIFMTTDNGTTDWVEISQNLPKGITFKSLTVVTSGGLKVLVASTSLGVMRAITPVANVFWTRFGLGLPNAVVTSTVFATRATSQVLGAGTQGRGAFAMYGNVAAQLGTTPTLKIDGTSASDNYKLILDANNPLILDVFINDLTTPVLAIPLLTIQNILINTNGGSDTLTVDSTNGAISVPGGIEIDAATTTVNLTGGTFVGSTTTVAAKNTTVVTMVGGDKETIVTNVAVTPNNTITLAGNDKIVGTGLGDFFNFVDNLGTLPTSGANSQPSLAMLDNSLFDSIMGVQQHGATADPDKGGKASAAGDIDSGINGFLRLIETGNGAFDLGSIGTTITTFAELQTALQNLGATDITGSDLTAVSFKLVKTLDGNGAFHTKFNFGGGEVALDGDFDVEAQVTLNLSFGVDATGFFVDSAGTSLAIDHISISPDGGGDAVGHFGFLDVNADIDTLTIAPTVGLNVALNGGKLRLSDLTGSLGSHVTVTATGATGDDIELKVNIDAQALVPGIDAIDLGGAKVTIIWANVSDATTATVTADAGLATDLLNFLKVNTQDLRDEIAKLTNLSTALHVNIPFVSNALGDVLDVVNFINNKIITPLTGGGATANFPSAQVLAAELISSLGITPAQFGLNYDAATKSLTFHVHVTNNVLNKTVSLGAGLNLADGLADLNFSTTASADANINLDLTFGIDLAAIIALKSPDQWFFLKDTSAAAHVDLAASDVNAEARFGFLSIEVFKGTVEAHADASIHLTDPGTDAADGRISLHELLNGFSNFSSLVNATFSGTATLQLPIKAPFLGINSNVVSVDNTLIVSIPDFTNFDTAHVQIPAAISDVGNFSHMDAASFVGLMGQVTGWLDQFRHSSTFANFNVPLLGPALDKVLALNAAFRNALLIDQGGTNLTDVIDGADKLASDINTALAASGFDKVLHTEIVGGKVSLIATDFSGKSFTVTATSGNELGFGTTQTSGNVTANGPEAVTATGAPSDPIMGKLAGDVTFAINYGGVINNVLITNGGSGYTSSPTVVFTGGGGSGATGTAVVQGGVVTSVVITNPGTGYTSNPIISFTGGGGTLAAGLANGVLVHKSDTDDNTGLGDDHWKLVNSSNGATFSTVDEMVIRIAQILNIPSPLHYDATSKTLTFTVALNPTFGQIDLPLNFDLNLAPLLQLTSNSSLRLTADGSLNLTVGVYLGDTPSSNMLDTNKNLTDVNGGVQNKTDLVVTGTSDVRTTLGGLSSDASFTIAVNGGAAKTVTILKSATADNTTAANLATDITAALVAAGVTNVTASAGGTSGNTILLTGGGGVTAIHLTASSANTAATEIGFAAVMDADVTTHIITSTKDLSTLYGRLTSDATFNVSLNGGAPVAVTVLKTATDANRFTFDIVSEVQSAINAIASLNGKITAGFSNGRLTLKAVAGTTSFSVTATGSAATELGLGASNTANSNEFNITTVDGTVSGINLDGIGTLGDLLAAIGSQSGGKVTAALNAKGTGINLTDTTTGGGTFKVTIANNSTAATTLGILGVDGLDADQAVNGVIAGGDIADISPADRFFLQDVNASVGLHLTSPSGVNLTAHLGFLSINLAGNVNVNATLGIALKDPGTTAQDGRISLTELFNGLSDISTLLDAPALTGGGDISLTVSVSPSLPGLTISADPIVLHINSWGDPFSGTAPDITLTVPDDLVAFNKPDFSFANILKGLKALADFLNQFQSFGFLSEKIPLINVSIDDLISLADKFATAVDQAGQDPAGTVQLLEDKLKGAFGIPLASPLLKLSLFTDDHGTPSDTSDDTYYLRITIDVKASFDKPVNFNFNTPGGVLGGSGGLDANGNLDVNLDFGINLHDPLDIEIFDMTGISAALNASASNLQFKAALGPLGVFIMGGSAAFAASLTGGIKASVFTNHHVALTDLISNLADDLNFTPSGSIHAKLPVFFPTESKHTDDITYDWADLTDGSGGILVVPSDTFTIDPSSFSLLDELGLGVDGIDFFLGGLQDALDGSIGGVKLPLIGDKLSGVATAIGDFRTNFIDPLREAIDAFSNPTSAFQGMGNDADPISKILFKLLGPAGLNVLQDSNNDHQVTVQDITYDGNAQTAGVSLADVFVHWHFKLGGTIVNANPGIGFDIGIPGLNLSSTGNLNVQIAWSLEFGFGLNHAKGFFIDVGSPAELSLSVDVTIPGASITGTLGFLMFTASDHIDPVTHQGTTHLGATFGIDIFDSSDKNATEMGFADIGNLDITPVIGADAVVDLDAKLSLSNDLIPGAATNFPSIVAEFVLRWGVGDRDNNVLVPLTELKGNFLSDGLQFVGFKNVGLDLGTYFSNVIEPIAKKIDEYTAPVKPFLDFITAPIPVISQLAGPTSMLDIAALSGEVSPEFIDAIKFIDKLIDIIDGFANSSPSGNAILMFGDFDIYNPAKNQTFDLTNPSSLSDALGNGGLQLPTWDSLGLGNFTNALGPVGDAFKDTFNAITTAAQGTPTTKLTFPIIQDPSQVFGLLMGKHATLIDLDLAPFDFKASFSAFFSIFGPLGVSINADFSMHIKFHFGYDSLGIEEFAKGGFKDPLLMFDGFYVDITDGHGKVIPQLTFDAGVWAAAELNLGIARAGVGGGLFAEVRFTLHDPDKDGKVRIKELLTDFLNEVTYGTPALAPLAIFDISGELTAKLFAFLKIDLGFFSIDKTFNITPPITLLSFGSDFFRAPTLATELGNGVLQLNMGPNSAQRIEGDLTDGDEQFFVKQGSDASHVLVWAPGFGIDEAHAQEYTCTTTLIADGGKGNDTVDASGVTANIDFQLTGDAGDDILKAGSGTGKALIYGGAGDDILWGGNGDDIIFGEAGKDEIHGLNGNDILIGDGDTKTTIQGNIVNLTAKASDGNDTIFGDGGIDLIIGGGGDDELHGGGGNDTIIGDVGKVTLDTIDARNVTAVEQTDKGKGGADTIFGDAGNDVIYGGAGNDTIDGGADDDTIFGESGLDMIHGGTGNDTIDGGTEADTIYGDAGNDTLTGGAANDTIYGDAGDNAPGGGDDTIFGGDGADILHGDAGNDHIFGNGDSDTMYGDDGNDYLEGGGGNDTVYGGAGHDTLVGGYGSDYLDGQADGDSYLISSRGGDLDQLTTAYDTGGAAGTDILTVTGTANDDTFLLRAMADYYYTRYFPAVTSIEQAASDAFTNAATTADRITDMETAITKVYGASAMFSVPIGMFPALEAQFTLNPNNFNQLKNQIDATYVESGLALLYSITESVFNDPAVAPAARVAKIEAGITEVYAPDAPPAGMFTALEAASNTNLTALENAIKGKFVTGTLKNQTAFVALLNNGGAHVERFNYRNMEGLVLNTIQGNDYVVLDDVIAATTINLGDGNDRVQVGQVFNSPRVGNFDTLITNIDPAAAFGTAAITRGWLSDGVSIATTINGGSGNDQFTVFRNTAVLNLNGGDGDDLFTIRAFALIGSTDSERGRTDLKGDAGADTVLYAVDAPVNIDGGDGFDTVRVVGTEFADDFVVTDKGVFGAGLNINYVNIEKLVADGAEGNDRFFVLSTGIDVATELDGGLGSDTFFIGGTPQSGPIPVVSNDLKGFSGVIEHSVNSTDPSYNGITVDGLSANVVDNEESNYIVTESGGISNVTEDAISGGEGWQFDTYSVRLSRAPGAGLNATINIVPGGIPPEDQAKGVKDLEFLLPGHSGALASDWVTADLLPALVFTALNWNVPQVVTFRAAHDDVAEGTRYAFINQATNNSTDISFANAKLLSVKVKINDDDKAGVLITPTNNSNTVVEGGAADNFNVVLTRVPTAPVTVTLSTANGKLAFSSADPRFNALTNSITFTNADYNSPVLMNVTAPDDSIVQGFHTDYISFTVASADVDTDLVQASYLVDGDFDLPGDQTIPSEKPTSYLFLKDTPDLSQPVVVQHDGNAVNVFDPNNVAQQSDNKIYYSISGNTITFYKNGNSTPIIGDIHISYSFIKAGYNDLIVKDQVVDITDTDSPSVIVTETNGSTDVIEGGTTDTYSLSLSKKPAPGTTVTVNINSVDTRTTNGATGNAFFIQHVTVNGLLSTSVVFNEFNWNVPQNVTVAAIDDAILDGDDTKVFAPQLQTTHKIRGPLNIQGAAGQGSLSLPAVQMLPGEKNIRPFDGAVVGFTPGAGAGATESMTVQKSDLLTKVAALQLTDPTITDIFHLVGKTIELTQGPGTGVILDPTNPTNLFNRFWLINAVLDLGGGLVQLTLQNPSAVNPSLLHPATDVPVPGVTKYAVTSLSVNFFADETKSIDYAYVLNNDSVANEVGSLTSSTGNILSFANIDATTDSMTVNTSDLQAILSLPVDGSGAPILTDLVGRTLDIPVGPGLGDQWTITGLTDGVVAGTKVFTLTRITVGVLPTNRSEFRVANGNTRGRITGFGMGPNIVIGNTIQSGGITYGDMEVMNIQTGKGDDTVNIDYTTNAADHTTKRSGPFYTLTMVNTGAGNDHVNSKLIAGQAGALSLDLGDGNDTFDGSGSSAPLTVFGDGGQDTITGGSGDDMLFGDQGRIDFVNGDGFVVTRLGFSEPLNPVNPTVESATLTTLTDTVTTFYQGHAFPTEFGGLVGLQLQVISPDGHVQFRTIIANTEDTVTIDQPFDTLPLFGNADPKFDSAYRVATLPEDQLDGNFRGPRLVESVFDDQGDNDTINGGGGNDLIIGGGGNDTIDAGQGNNMVAGDGAIFNYVPVTGNDGPTKLLSIIDPGGPGNDMLTGGGGDDLLIGGLGDDIIHGGAGNDILIGDEALITFAADGVTPIIIDTVTVGGAGGIDTIYGQEGDDILIGGFAGDNLDGGAGQDLIFGDNVVLTRNVGSGDAISPRFRALTGSTLYDVNGVAQVGAAHMPVPGGMPAWADFTIMLEQSNSNYGNDNIAGGAGNDEIFGQLGNDTIQGDGSIALNVSAITPSADDYNGVGTDGDDYIEGNGGADLIFGNLGQDDIIGGSSDLFSYATAARRPDVADTIFGGSGTHNVRNDVGLTTADAHARDADTILGDNGDIFRIVNANGTAYLTFNYDNYATTLRIIPRAVKFLDYTPGIAAGMPVGDKGGNDRIHGEAGDDEIYGQVGSDMLYGDGQDDNIYGGSGADWISGGTGDDGILGDDGRISTSRNGLAEPLYGVVAIPPGKLDLVISTPGNRQQATINPSGVILKAVDMNPFTTGGNDIIYGGLGNDFLHGGAGDDAISGAEALPNFFAGPSNNGNALLYSLFDPTEFALYDPYNPMKKIPNFILNFNATDTLPDTSTTTNDGNDNIFGDTGNDWIVGGTGNDWMFGGYGNDLINADGNLDTNGGLNNTTDPAPFAGNDIAYGGAGLDVLIANTGADRLIDWVGEFNSYIVPFSPFGAPTISRTVQPQIFDYLYQLAASVGSDQTRITGFSDGPVGDPARYGEPFGELGLVNQKDPDWNDQTGAPRDPQPGNTQGPRDTRLLLNFAAVNSATGFSPDSGSWTVTNGRYQTSGVTGQQSVSLQFLDSQLPSYNETYVTINANGGSKSNGYVIFDYQSASDFKFAGVDSASGKLVIGNRTSAGWIVLASSSTIAKLRGNSDATVELVESGSTAFLIYGSTTIQYAWAATDPLNDGLIGLGTDASTTTFDDYSIKFLSPTVQLTLAPNLSGGSSSPLTNTIGTWTLANGIYSNSTSTGTNVAILAGTLMGAGDTFDLTASVSTNSSGGLIFDYQSPSDYKFAMLLPATNQIVIGHVFKGVTAYDAVASAKLKFGTNYALTFTVQDGNATLSYTAPGTNGSVSFNYGGELLVDGGVGTISINGTTSFSAYSFDIRR